MTVSYLLTLAGLNRQAPYPQQPNATSAAITTSAINASAGAVEPPEFLANISSENAGADVGTEEGVRIGLGLSTADGVDKGVGVDEGAGVGAGVDAGVGAGVGDGVGASVGDGVGVGVGTGVGEGIGTDVSALVVGVNVGASVLVAATSIELTTEAPLTEARRWVEEEPRRRAVV